MERLLTYDRLISYHRNKLDVKPFPSDKLNMGYLDNKYNQFLIHLNNSDVELIKKTIKEIYNQLQLGDEVFKYSIKNPELLDKVFEYLIHFGRAENTDIYPGDALEVRKLSAECFKQFCLLLTVKEHLHEGKFIKFIHKTFGDDSEDVKLNVYQGLIYFAQSRYGIDTLLQNEILQQIIVKIREEKSHKVINLILILCNEILNAETAPQIALSCGIIQNLKIYLNTDYLPVKENVILNFGSLSLCEEGKKDCVEEGSLIKNIISFLSGESNLQILIASTRFLMSTSILKRGKVEIYENDGIESCMTLLETHKDYTNEKIIQLVINILQLIGNVAEEPRGRKKLSQSGFYLQSIETLLTHENRFIKEQAKITRNIITWKP